MQYENWSYGALTEFGIEVCCSCGGANLNSNYKKTNKSLPIDWCFDCSHNEGSTICMPDDDVFYPQAKKTLNKLTKKESK